MTDKQYAKMRVPLVVLGVFLFMVGGWLSAVPALAGFVMMGGLACFLLAIWLWAVLPY